MEILLSALLAALLLTAAFYAHKQLPLFTKSPTRVRLARTMLVLVGIGFGWTLAVWVQGDMLQLLTFLIGFGMVHVPAAIILFVKGRRGEGKS